MKKSLCLGIVISIFLAGGAYAFDFNGAKGKVDFNALYISSQRDSGSGITANGIALNPLFAADGRIVTDLEFEAGAAIAVSHDEKLAAFAGRDDIAKEEKYGAVDETEVFLNIYSVKKEFEESFVKVGAQEISTPMLRSDTARLIPNTFEAVAYEKRGFLKNTKLGGYYILNMYGWDNRDYAKRKAGMAEALLARVSDDMNHTAADNGMVTLGAVYDDGSLKASFWSFNILGPTDVSNDQAEFELSPVSINYVDLGYFLDNGIIEIDASLQYYRLDGDVKNGTLKRAEYELGHKVNGFMVKVKHDLGFSILTATNTANVNRGGTGVINAWGGFPEYAAAGEYKMSSFANRKFTSVKIGAAFEREEFEIGAYMTMFGGEENTGEDKSATVSDIALEYKKFSFVYENQRIDKSDPNDIKDVSNSLVKFCFRETF